MRMPFSPTRSFIRFIRSYFFFSVSLSILSLPSAAQEVVSASSDVTIDLGAGIVATDDAIVVDNQMGILALESLGSLPESSEIVGYVLDANGDRLLTFDTTVDLGGGVVARAGDVVRYDGVGYSIEFDASAAGVAPGVIADAVSVSANGLLLSFDTTADLGGGLVAADEDLVEWNGTSFSLLLDASAHGLAEALDIDAAHAVGGGVFVVSFDTGGEVGGVAFDDEDLLRYDGVVWSMELDASSLNAGWSGADLDAVHVPEAGLAIGLLLGSGLLTSLSARRRRISNSRRQRHERLPRYQPGRWELRALACRLRRLPRQHGQSQCGRNGEPRSEYEGRFSQRHHVLPLNVVGL